MFVLKHDGHMESFNVHKLGAHITKFCFGLDEAQIGVRLIVEEIVAKVHDGITTRDLDTLTVETVASRKAVHRDCNVLAGRLRVSSLHSHTIKRFSTVVAELYGSADGSPSVMSEESSAFITDNADALDSVVLHARDYNFNFDDFEALSQHLLKVKGKVVERPQHMFMRAAISMRGENTDSVIEAYDALSRELSRAESAGHFETGSWRTMIR